MPSNSSHCAKTDMAVPLWEMSGNQWEMRGKNCHGGAHWRALVPPIPSRSGTTAKLDKAATPVLPGFFAITGSAAITR